LPYWSAFSDAFPGARGTGVTAMSWTVVLIEIVGAALMGAIGLSIVLKERGYAAVGMPRRSSTGPSRSTKLSK
jgi:hypothetical protein